MQLVQMYVILTCEWTNPLYVKRTRGVPACISCFLTSFMYLGYVF